MLGPSEPVNWAETTAMLACALNTPIDTVWTFTIGQIVRYTGCIQSLMPFHNPFAGGASDSAQSAPPGSIDTSKSSKQAIAALAAAGAKVVRKPHG